MSMRSRIKKLLEREGFENVEVGRLQIHPSAKASWLSLQSLVNTTVGSMKIIPG